MTKTNFELPWERKRWHRKRKRSKVDRFRSPTLVICRLACERVLFHVFSYSNILNTWNFTKHQIAHKDEKERKIAFKWSIMHDHTHHMYFRWNRPVTNSCGKWQIRAFLEYYLSFTYCTRLSIVHYLLFQDIFLLTWSGQLPLPKVAILKSYGENFMIIC